MPMFERTPNAGRWTKPAPMPAGVWAAVKARNEIIAKIPNVNSQGSEQNRRWNVLPKILVRTFGKNTRTTADIVVARNRSTTVPPSWLRNQRWIAFNMWPFPVLRRIFQRCIFQSLYAQKDYHLRRFGRANSFGMYLLPASASTDIPRRKTS